MTSETWPSAALVGLWLLILAMGGLICGLACVATGAEWWVPSLALTSTGILFLTWDYIQERRQASTRSGNWLTRL